MTREDFIILREEAIKREGTLLLAKGAEYHSDEDFLENFKEDGPDVGVEDPKKTLMIYAGKHWRSIQRYAKTGREGAEPIEGRVDDLVNYMHLFLGLIKEKNNERATTEGRSNLTNNVCACDRGARQLHLPFADSTQRDCSPRP